MIEASEGKIIEESRPAAKRRAVYLLIALCGVAFFLGLGRLALTGPDEPRYAEVAREMFASGDYISPRLAGCLWFEKPALVYWMAAASYRLFSVDEFAARFPSAFAALLTSLFVYYAASRPGSRRLGMLAAFALATSGLFIGYARSVTTDMALAASMGIAMLSVFLFGESTGRARKFFWSLCWASLGLAALAKGLVGILLGLAIMVIWFYLAGGMKTVGWRWWLAGLAIMVLVSSIWYVPVTVKHGWAFIDEFIIEHHFQRYLTARHSHPQPVYYYLFVTPAGLLPWTFFLIPAIAGIRRLRPRSDMTDRLLALCWVWVMVMVAFFSFSGSKLPGYILPIFPALAVIVGSEMERAWRSERGRLLQSAMWLSALLALAIGIAFPVYLKSEGVTLSGWHMPLVWLPLASGLIALIMLITSRNRIFILGAGAVVLAVVAGAAVLLLPQLSEKLSLKTLSLEATSRLRPGERIGFFIMKEFAPVFYAEGRVVCGTGEGTLLNALSEDTLAEALERESSIIIFTTDNWIERLEVDPRFLLERIGSQRKALALRVSLKK
jgi:4-amino-4-deoxy-L-arabinose transferase-like glycosyltransferase